MIKNLSFLSHFFKTALYSRKKKVSFLIQEKTSQNLLLQKLTCGCGETQCLVAFSNSRGPSFILLQTHLLHLTGQFKMAGTSLMLYTSLMMWVLIFNFSDCLGKLNVRLESFKKFLLIMSSLYALEL